MCYKSLEYIFYEYYHKGKLKHNDLYSTYFNEGDVVTTEGGFDLGIVARACDGSTPRVYVRFTKLQDFKQAVPNMYGGTNRWYKLGFNVPMWEWKLICRKYW